MERSAEQPASLSDLTRLFAIQEQRLVSMQDHLVSNLYRQLEALTALYQLLDIRAPLPPLRGWGISPDLAVLLYRISWRRRPSAIVELGSGSSTIVLAYILEKLGHGELISIEHDRDYLDRTRGLLDEHGLEGVVNQFHAPLTQVDLDQGAWQWYDLSGIELPSAVDLLVVDGPPGPLQPRSRYPALPMLEARLAEDCVVVLDDARRPDETNIVAAWLARGGGWQHEFYDLEKGASVLTSGPPRTCPG